MVASQIRVLLFPGDLEGVWLAVGLEHYIVSQGNSMEEAAKYFFRSMLEEQVVAKEIGGVKGSPFQHIPVAPRRYWKMYESAKPIESKVEELFGSGIKTSYNSKQTSSSSIALLSSINTDVRQLAAAS